MFSYEETSICLSDIYGESNVDVRLAFDSTSLVCNDHYIANHKVDSLVHANKLVHNA